MQTAHAETDGKQDFTLTFFTPGCVLFFNVKIHYHTCLSGILDSDWWPISVSKCFLVTDFSFKLILQIAYD